MPRLTGSDKRLEWAAFAAAVARLSRSGSRGLRALAAADLSRLLDQYQALTADLARARSLGAPSATIDELNRTAVAAHNLLYGAHRPPASATPRDWPGIFARAVRRSAAAAALAALMLFAPAVLSYVAVTLHPELGYDLVPDGFLDFDPAQPENLHDIPSLARPVASSAIMTNNIQASLLAFGLGLTFGVGTTLILVLNGVQIGAVAAWMALAGKERALWGWIMPHGGTELLAITLAGGAGYVLAGALAMPGELPRAVALRRVAGRALAIELGVMAMLIVAGLIEGFVSPSALPYAGRIAVLAASLLLWSVFFLGAGRSPRLTT